MRAFIILLMAVTALLASVSGSVSNLQTSQSLVQPINAAEPEMTQGRLLLRTAPVDDEERGAGGYQGAGKINEEGDQGHPPQDLREVLPRP